MTISQSTRSTPRFFVPEAVQTSTMDCGPAALKSLLEGFGIPANYGRLREACQTDVDGTSINTLEDVAQALGLQAEQLMAPVDHLLLPTAQLLPALVVTRLPNGFQHFLVVWSTHGPFVQLMDPTTGRRWVRQRNFLTEVYRYTIPVSVNNWRTWATSDGFLGPLQERLSCLEIPTPTTTRLIDESRTAPDWQPLATLDAATRMVSSLVQARGVAQGEEATRLVEELFTQAQEGETNLQKMIPPPFWSVRPLPGSHNQRVPETDLLLMQGAVLLKIAGRQPERTQHHRAQERELDRTDRVTSTHTETDRASAPPAPSVAGTDDEAPSTQAEQRSTILGTALADITRRPEWELIKALREDGQLTPALLISGTAIAALGVTVEAALLRGLMAWAVDFSWGPGRLFLLGGLTLFVLLMLLLEFPIAAGALRTGRRLETRIRIAFLEKLPRLSDRYFHSRLISDMAQRAFSLHQLHALPDLTVRVVRLIAQIIFTTAGISWLYPAATPIALLVMITIIATTLLLQPFQSERDMRVRTHTGALSRFYLDALLGLLPIRTHSAERTVRREHEMLLVSWARESLALARYETLLQSVITFSSISLVIGIVMSYVTSRGEASTLLLLLYWSLNLPVLGQALVGAARQYPAMRNNMARILEPLSAPEEEFGNIESEQTVEHEQTEGQRAHVDPMRGVDLRLEQVQVQAGGHLILDEIQLTIAPGEHVAIVGESGAGKSSLVGLLLGWYRPTAGRILVDNMPLDGSQLRKLRRQTAWVDPTVQLWNRPLQENLRYGNENSVDPSKEQPIGVALGKAELYDVLEQLPYGLQTRLGESGGLVSGGEGQRVRFGRALSRVAVRLAILDEPFRGLDRAKRRSLLATARRHWQHTTLLCITHDIADTADFSRVLVIEHGRIVEDGVPRTLLATPTSPYRKLFDRDETIRTKRWATTAWRRLWLSEGQLQANLTPPISTSHQAAENGRQQQRSAPQDGTEQTNTEQQNLEQTNLQQLRGIGPIWEKRLQAVGITTISDLAAVDSATLKARFKEKNYPLAANIAAWIEQAQQLSEREAK